MLGRQKGLGMNKRLTDHCTALILDAPDVTDVARQPKKDNKLVLGCEVV